MIADRLVFNLAVFMSNTYNNNRLDVCSDDTTLLSCVSEFFTPPQVTENQSVTRSTRVNMRFSETVLSPDMAACPIASVKAMATIR